MGECKQSQCKAALDEIGPRLRSVADRFHEGNKSELARSLGMKPSSFAKYLNGDRRPGAVVLEKLSRMGVDINWLLTGSGTMLDETARIPSSLDKNSPPDGQDSRSVTQDSTPHFHEIPLVRIREDRTGALQLIETDGAEWISESFIREEYGVRPELLRDFPISGDSMLDTIRPGDRVRGVLWNCRAPNDGTICILRGPISLMVRRVRLRNEHVLLIADNPDVSDLKINMNQWEETYEPIARILEVRRAL